jgi:hypothetical protein
MRRATAVPIRNLVDAGLIQVLFWRRNRIQVQICQGCFPVPAQLGPQGAEYVHAVIAAEDISVQQSDTTPGSSSTLRSGLMLDLAVIPKLTCASGDMPELTRALAAHVEHPVCACRLLSLALPTAGQQQRQRSPARLWIQALGRV